MMLQYDENYLLIGEMIKEKAHSPSDDEVTEMYSTYTISLNYLLYIF